LENEERYLRMASAPNPYGDGTSSSQITSVLKKNL